MRHAECCQVTSGLLGLCLTADGGEIRWWITRLQCDDQPRGLLVRSGVHLFDFEKGDRFAERRYRVLWEFRREIEEEEEADMRKC